MEVSIKPSNLKDKKYTAVYYDNDKKVKTIHFGAKGMNDYTLTGDKKARDSYRARHKAIYNKAQPMSASHLSYLILWGDSTDINKNIASYKKKYGFQ